MRTEFLCVSVIRVASGPRVNLVSCKSALTPPMVYSTDRSKAVVPVLVLLFVALWFILRGDLLYVFPCVILFLCFSVILVLRLPRLGKKELILVHFVRLFDLCLFGFVGFLCLLVSGKGCGLWLWHSLDFSLTLFFHLFAYVKGYDFSRKYYLGIHIVNLENTVLSTSCRSYHEECTDLYIYTYHDLVESQCSPRKFRFGVSSPPTYLVKPDCSAHRFI